LEDAEDLNHCKNEFMFLVYRRLTPNLVFGKHWQTIIQKHYPTLEFMQLSLHCNCCVFAMRQYKNAAAGNDFAVTTYSATKH